MNEWIKRLDLNSPRSLRVLFWLGGTSLCLGIFIKLTWELREDSDLEQFDQLVLVLISKLRVAALNGAAVDLTALGSPTVIFFFTVLGLVLLLLNQDKWGALYLATGSAGAGFWTYLLKHFISRERPTVVPRLVEVSGFSYPSGHSLAAASFYLILMFLACRHFRSFRNRLVLFICTGVLIGSVCFSRLYLGVHYPSDVASGAFLGAAWAFAITALFSRRSEILSSAVVAATKTKPH